MRDYLRRFLFLIVLTIVLAACGQDKSVEQIPIDKVKSDIKEYIEINATEKGIYLFQHEKDFHIYVNSGSVNPKQVKNVEIKTEGNVLKVYIDENKVAKKSNEDKGLYFIQPGDLEYDTRVVIQNGKEVSINMIVGM